MKGMSRRGFLQVGVVAGAGAAVASQLPAAEAAEPDVSPAALSVRNLTVGDMPDPMGIQVAQPRLSWQLQAGGVNRSQSAYEIRVASDPGRISRADLWRSGRVSSGQSRNVVYGGNPLASRTRAYWQVRAWDEAGRVSAWSDVARWETGLLQPEDWRAQWIGNADWDRLSAPVPPVTVNIPAQQARYVRLNVTKLGLPLKEGWPDPVSRLQLAEVQVVDSAHPDVDLALHGAVTASEVYSAPGTWEPQYIADGKTTGDTSPIGYTSLEHHGQDVSSAPVWVTIDLGAPQTFDRLVLYPRTDTFTPDGQVANFPVDFTVQVASDAAGPFSVAATITGQAGPPVPELPAGLPLFAKQFVVGKPVTRARLYITGLGIYTATVNGNPTGTAVLEPGNTTYAKHVDYATADVTELLQRGANAVGVRVGTGIYDTLTYNTRYLKFSARIGPPKLLAQLEITYGDGTTQTIATDPTWRTTTGPTTFSNWYGGEDYDARRLPAGWDRPGTDLSAWSPVITAQAPGGVLTGRSGPAVEPVETLQAKAITQPSAGLYVFDFGVNVAGWQRLSVSGPAGAKITMRPAELVHPDGTVDPGSTGNPIYDDYTLRGDGVETWHPDFIYHGFRYIQVEGLPTAPTKDTLTAIVLRAANVGAGSFTSSNDLINGIHRIIDRATQSNMFSVLTDCPTREKLGWMEEDHLVFAAVARNYDVAAYGYDLAQAMADAQLSNGLVPDIAPEYTVFSGGFRDDPNWGSSMVLVPWNLYRAYGDPTLIETYYPNMQGYVDYLSTKASGGLLDYGLGDWATINAATPAGVTATYGYFKCADALSRIAGVLGRDADASRYGQLAQAIGAAFHAKYFDAANHTYATGSQASDALALDMGIVPAAEHDAVLGHLVANLQANGYHLNLGEIGLPALFDVLSAAGRHDVIFQIATQTTVPSYGAMLARGATSLTEFWDGTGSQNHFMLGAIDKWFTSCLTGIGQADDDAGFADLVIAPAIVGDLTFVRGRYATPRGDVTSEWTRSGNDVVLDVTVPVGAKALIRLAGQPDQRVGSGAHRFRSTLS
jgi:alpha-L-rhamnosidase